MIADLHAWSAYHFNRDCCGDLRPTTEPPGLKYCAACYETEVAQDGPCLPRERILNSCLMLRDPTLHGRPLPTFRPRAWRRRLARQAGRPGLRVHRCAVSFPAAMIGLAWDRAQGCTTRERTP